MKIVTKLLIAIDAEKQMWFSEGIIYYLNDEPTLLCKARQELQVREWPE